MKVDLVVAVGVGRVVKHPCSSDDVSEFEVDPIMAVKVNLVMAVEVGMCNVMSSGAVARNLSFADAGVGKEVCLISGIEVGRDVGVSFCSSCRSCC